MEAPGQLPSMPSPKSGAAKSLRRQVSLGSDGTGMTNNDAVLYKKQPVVRAF